MSDAPRTSPEQAVTAEHAVEIVDARKTYRLYSAPLYRVLDLLGLCPSGGGYYSEHDAVDGVSLSIRRGEKVAIIGRNGAGKSTLLKMITGTVRPTSGSVDVHGTVSALLQIGTGFHPDFTGRQNVYSGFAHMGITGRRADRLFEEVVDFAELEAFIDQPMKTFSTGMGARLMFSAATVLEPEILVIDELLGVGDAYFAHKSYERMQQMCSRAGTTLLLVTHDVYSAMNLCDRFIWIDRGTVRLDADPRSVVNAYEHSIKEQEEDRLRRRHAASSAALSAADRRWRIRIGSRTGFALPQPVAIESIALEASAASSRLEVATGAEGWSLLPEGNLGPPARVAGRTCRSLDVKGSIFHKAEWIAELPSAADGTTPTGLELTIRYEGDPDGEPAEITVAPETGAALLRRLVRPAAGWRTIRFDPSEPDEDAPDRESSGQYGTGLVRIESIAFLDGDGAPVVSAPHGGSLLVEVELRVSADLSDREVTFVLGFHKAGAALGGYVHRERLALPGDERCTVSTSLDPLLLGSGDWLVTVGVAEPEFYRQSHNPFFSVNERWHHLMTRCYDLAVESTDAIDGAAFVVHPADVRVTTGPTTHEVESGTVERSA